MLQDPNNGGSEAQLDPAAVPAADSKYVWKGVVYKVQRAVSRSLNKGCSFVALMGDLAVKCFGIPELFRLKKKPEDRQVQP